MIDQCNQCKKIPSPQLVEIDSECTTRGNVHSLQRCVDNRTGAEDDHQVSSFPVSPHSLCRGRGRSESRKIAPRHCLRGHAESFRARIIFHHRSREALNQKLHRMRYYLQAKWRSPTKIYRPLFIISGVHSKRQSDDAIYRRRLIHPQGSLNKAVGIVLSDTAMSTIASRLLEKRWHLLGEQFNVMNNKSLHH